MGRFGAAGQGLQILVDFLFLARAHLGGDVRPAGGEGTGFPAAAVRKGHAAAQQFIDHLHRLIGLHRCMAGIVIQVLLTADAVQLDAFFHQVFMDVDDAAAGEDVLEAVLRQLVVAGAAADHHGFDVQIIQRGGHAVEQHPVLRGDGVALVLIAGAGLRIAAAQIAGRQHCLRADMPQHGLGGEADLAEQALRTAAGEVEHRFSVFRELGVADDGHDAGVFHVQQRARGFLGQAAGHGFVDEVDHLLLDRSLADGGRRLPGLGAYQPQAFTHRVAQSLGFVGDADQACAQRLDGGRILGGKKGHADGGAGVEALVAGLAQEVAHGHRNIAEVDLDRARFDATMADRAMVGHVGQFLEVLEADAAAGLLLVEEGLGQQADAEDLVARRVQQIGARYVSGAHRLAFAAAQAVLDRVADGADVGLFQNQRLGAQQGERRGIGHGEVGAGQQFPAVEVTVGVHLLFVGAERGDFLLAEEFQLGDADAVLAGNHAAQRARQRHDAFHRLVRGLQHLVVVGVDRQVGVDVAVAGVHVQGDEDAAAQHFLLDGADGGQNGAVGVAGEQLFQFRLHFALPADAHDQIAQRVKYGVRSGGGVFQRRVRPAFAVFVEGTVKVFQQPLPAVASDGELGQRRGAAVADQLFRRQIGVQLVHWQPAVEILGQGVEQAQLVLDRQFDVDALDAVAVVAQPRQRNHHVFVDLEGVGVLGDGGGAAAVQPEALARFRGNGDEALAVARIGQPHHLAGGFRHCILVVRYEVRNQHHLGPALAFGLGHIGHRAHIAPVQMFEAGQLHAGGQRGAAGLEQIGDFDDGRRGFGHGAEEFEADGANMLGHAVQHEARAGDDAVAAFFLHAGQAGQEFVSNVFAQAHFAEGAAGDVQLTAGYDGATVILELADAEAGDVDVVDLAVVVAQAFNELPLAVRVHHLPAGEVVQRGAPQHCFLAAGVHCDIAADTGGLRRGGVHREH